MRQITKCLTRILSSISNRNTGVLFKTKMDHQVTESFEKINEVPTQILTIGKGFNDDLTNITDLILIFPGNPGIADYYIDFMKLLFERLNAFRLDGKSIPVWTVGHAGHFHRNCIPKQDFPPVSKYPELYQIEGQVHHKIVFIKKFIPSHIRIHGVGHSIGSYMWLKVMKALETDVEDRKEKSLSSESETPVVNKCYMLFPTLERMRETPNGQFILNTLVRYERILSYMLPILPLLPRFLKVAGLKLYYRGRSLPNCFTEATLQLLNHHVLLRVQDLGKSELDRVFHLDTEAIIRLKDGLFIYFGAKDNWYPLSFVESLLERFPDLNYEICSRGIEHAFVLDHNVEMAEYLSPLIEKRINSY